VLWIELRVVWPLPPDEVEAPRVAAFAAITIFLVAGPAILLPRGRGHSRKLGIPGASASTVPTSGGTCVAIYLLIPTLGARRCGEFPVADTTAKRGLSGRPSPARRTRRRRCLPWRSMPT
jgi:hypothetical protein